MPATKKFLIQFESAPSTRWLYSLHDQMQCLKVLAEAAADVQTQGPRPRVTVIAEETPDEIPALLHHAD